MSEANLESCRYLVLSNNIVKRQRPGAGTDLNGTVASEVVRVEGLVWRP